MSKLNYYFPIFCILFFCSFIVERAESYTVDKILNIYSWAGYLPNDVIEQFKKETGIKINYTTFDSNETLYAKLKANPKLDYDIIIPSTYYVDKMRKENMLHTIDSKRIIGLDNINPKLLHQNFDINNEYSIPYLWSATGIAYNDKYINKNVLSNWTDLWKSEYINQLLILNDVREVFSIALFALDYSPNDQNSSHIEKAFNLLKELIPNIKLFTTDGIKNLYIDEDIKIGMAWNGDIYLVSLENPHVQFIYPNDGFIISLDSICIPKYATHIDNAISFINFILKPEIAKRICEETGYTIANLAAKKLLPDQLANNHILFPTSKEMLRAKFQTDVGSAAATYDNYFEELKIII